MHENALPTRAFVQLHVRASCMPNVNIRLTSPHHVQNGLPFSSLGRSFYCISTSHCARSWYCHTLIIILLKHQPLGSHRNRIRAQQSDRLDSKMPLDVKWNPVKGFRSTRISQQVWDTHRHEILTLYQDHSLGSVIEIMR